MNDAITFLKGKRTYFVVAIGLLYVAGVYLGFWEWDEKVLAAFGLGGIAFLRSALKSSGTKLPLLLVAALAIGAMGCATTDKPGRVLASAAITVDHAMEGWAIYAAAGHATPAEESRVESAYVKYQLALRTARGAYAAYQVTRDMKIWDTARVALETTQADLLRLLEELGTKPVESSP